MFMNVYVVIANHCHSNVVKEVIWVLWYDIYDCEC
jgi:hypothetical protein